FYVVPRGAHRLLHDGTISGDDPRTGWAPGLPSNQNVYPPIFTLTVGGLLQRFSPAGAKRIWLFAKLASLAMLALYAARRFARARDVGFLLIVLCCSPGGFFEVQILQYQWLLNLALAPFLFLFCRQTALRA